MIRNIKFIVFILTGQFGIQFYLSFNLTLYNENKMK